MTADLLGLGESTGRVDRRLQAQVRTMIEADQAADPLDATLTQLLPVLHDLVPLALARHRALGVSPQVTRQTLQDVGRKARLYGPDLPLDWLVGLLRADVVALGRLQFSRLSGPSGHDVHVPETGPLLPGLVDESLRRAVAELGATAFTCESWLLDPFVADELPEGSNLVRFARRFTVPETARPTGPAPTRADAEVARFVFRRPLTDVLDPARVTPRTTLERLVVRRLRAGEHWTEPRGTMRAPVSGDAPGPPVP